MGKNDKKNDDDFYEAIVILERIVELTKQSNESLKRIEDILSRRIDAKEERGMYE